MFEVFKIFVKKKSIKEIFKFCGNVGNISRLILLNNRFSRPPRNVTPNV